jgi:hypothetical protein
MLLAIGFAAFAVFAVPLDIEIPKILQDITNIATTSNIVDSSTTIVATPTPIESHIPPASSSVNIGDSSTTIVATPTPIESHVPPDSSTVHTTKHSTTCTEYTPSQTSAPKQPECETFYSAVTELETYTIPYVVCPTITSLTITTTSISHTTPTPTNECQCYCDLVLHCICGDVNCVQSTGLDDSKTLKNEVIM